MKTPTLITLCLPLAVILSSCTTLETAPKGQREAIPPQGSSENEKPWNAPTKQEGDAILGPLSEPRR